VPDRWWLCTLHFRLPALLTLNLNLLLRRSALLLAGDHLLPGSRPLYLLLLAKSLSLALLLHLLAHPFALWLLRAKTLCALLLNLLPAKFLHLLASVSITARRLSRQIHHLSFSRLLRSQVLSLARRCFALL
jgi:hypothetical protein